MAGGNRWEPMGSLHQHPATFNSKDECGAMHEETDKLLSADSQELESLIKRAKDGERLAIGQLLQKYRSFMRVSAERALGPSFNARVGASDVVQMTDFEAYRAFAQFEGETVEQFSAWLRKILKHNLANVIRDNTAAKRAVTRENKQPPTQDQPVIPWVDMAADDKTPSVRFLEGERAQAVLAALQTLPDDQQTAVKLRYLEGHSYADVAEQLDRSVDATAGLIKRGLKSLRAIVPSL